MADESAGSAKTEAEMDLLEMAWGVIANADSADWNDPDNEWRQAAERWRDRYHAALDAHLSGRCRTDLKDLLELFPTTLPLQRRPPRRRDSFGRKRRRVTGVRTLTILAGQSFPALRRLGLGAADGSFAAAVASAPAVAQLKAGK